MSFTAQRQAAGITILGATGSIGASTLDVISRHPDRYRVVALTANRDVDTIQTALRRDGGQRCSSHAAHPVA